MQHAYRHLVSLESTAGNPMVCSRLRQTATAPSVSKRNSLPPSRSNRSASFKASLTARGIGARGFSGLQLLRQPHRPAGSVRAPRRPLLMRSLPGALAPRRKHRIGTGSRRRSRRTGRRTALSQQPAPPALPPPRQHLRARTCSSPGHERRRPPSRKSADQVFVELNI